MNEQKLKLDLPEHKIPKELIPVQVPTKPLPDTSVNIFYRIKYFFHIKIQESDQKMWDTLKTYLVGMILRWIAKIGGGILLTIGISQNSWEEIVTAILSILIGIITSLVQHKKIALTEPNEFLN